MTPVEWTTMLGFLAMRQARVYLQVLERNEQEFLDEYQLVTGQSPIPLKGSGYNVVDPTVDKWGNASSVVFIASDGELFGLHTYSIAFSFNANVKKVARGQQWEIATNEIVWKLLEAGFILGTEQDITRIQNNVADGLLEAFGKGLELGRRPVRR